MTHRSAFGVHVPAPAVSWHLLVLTYYLHFWQLETVLYDRQKKEKVSIFVTLNV
jgi:hypothetical protein